MCYNQVKLWALQSFFLRYLFVLAFFSPQFEIRILISRFFEESGEFYHQLCFLCRMVLLSHTRLCRYVSTVFRPHPLYPYRAISPWCIHASLTKFITAAHIIGSFRLLFSYSFVQFLVTIDFFCAALKPNSYNILTSYPQNPSNTHMSPPFIEYEFDPPSTFMPILCLCVPMYVLRNF